MLFFGCLWVCITISQVSSAEWFTAHHLHRTRSEWCRAVLKWTTLPVVFILLFVAPVLEAHWKLFKKEKLTYAVAPKSAGSTPSVSCNDLAGLGADKIAQQGSGGDEQHVGARGKHDGTLALI